MEYKKFGIINYWYCEDHGAILTAYSLYKILSLHGICAELILMNCDHPKRDGISADFFTKYACYNNKILKHKKDFLNYTGFLVGSDQVFRPEWVPKEWFLDYYSNKPRKIAISASFGDDLLHCSFWKRMYFSFWIKRFEFLSIREHGGVELCKRITRRNDVYHIIDPVFLLDVSYFDDIISDSNILLPERYILCYFRDADEQLDKSIDYFCCTNGYERVDVNSSMKVEDFLKLLSNSCCVFTDSYHGMCFSMIFGVQFLCLKNSFRGASRYDSLILDFELEDDCFCSSIDEYIAILNDYRIDNLKHNYISDKRIINKSKEYIFNAVQE